MAYLGVGFEIAFGSEGVSEESMEEKRRLGTMERTSLYATGIGSGCA